MKFLKYFFGANIAAALCFLSFGVHLTSCTKEVEHDTVTIVDKDTIRITDTVCHVEVGMVAHYSFTDGSLVDESGNHNDIIFNSAVKTTGRSGAANSAYLFDGASTYMRVANSASLNPDSGISIVAVLKPNDFYYGTCHYSQVVGKGYPDPVQGFYSLRFTDPFGHCYEAPDTTKEFFTGGYGDNVPEGTAAGLAADTSLIHSGQWYVAVYTFDGHESRVYVNGVLKAIKTQTAAFTPNNHDLFIGKHEDPSFPYLFNGVIDEVRIYNRALCSCEVEQLNKYDQTAN